MGGRWPSLPVPTWFVRGESGRTPPVIPGSLPGHGDWASDGPLATDPVPVDQLPLNSGKTLRRVLTGLRA